MRRNRQRNRRRPGSSRPLLKNVATSCRVKHRIYQFGQRWLERIPIGVDAVWIERIEADPPTLFEIHQRERFGGVGEKVASQLAALTGKESRTVVLGHLLRGGSPTSVDRLLGLRFGAAAVRALDEGRAGIMVALDPPTVYYVMEESPTIIDRKTAGSNLPSSPTS